MSEDIRPFKINVPNEALSLLKQKLSVASFPTETLFTDDAQCGTRLSDMKRLTEHWKNGFDWREQEAKLNKLPHFTTGIAMDGFEELQIHFVHQRSKRLGSIPLLFCHGWPGSFLEVIKILPLLTESQDGPSFHVVAPSLPNFGFSDLVKDAGFGIPKYGQVLHSLMLKLGYDKYVTQGGDWGFFITRSISAQFPEHCVASHVNMVIVHPTLLNAAKFGLQYALDWFTSAEKEGLARTRRHLTHGTGYLAEQSSKPSTIGFALADSPIGLLSWIYEKMRDWTDGYAWTDDEILTWVSIYQFSKAGPAASVRIYYEARHSEMEETARAMKHVPKVPLGISCFPKDISPIPLAWCKELGPIVFQARHEFGGHFASHERPEHLVEDLRTMFGEGGGAETVAALFTSRHIY